MGAEFRGTDCKAWKRVWASRFRRQRSPYACCRWTGTPVGLEAFARLWAHFVHGLAQNAATTVVAQRAEPLPDHGGAGGRILFRALSRNLWKSTPIQGVPGNLLIQQQRAAGRNNRQEPVNPAVEGVCLTSLITCLRTVSAGIKH